MMPVPDARIQRTYRVRVALFVVGTVLLLLLLGYLYQGIQTLSALDQIESELLPRNRVGYIAFVIICGVPVVDAARTRIRPRLDRGNSRHTRYLEHIAPALNIRTNSGRGRRFHDID